MNNLSIININSLDYLDSSDPVKIDQGIRDTIRDIRASTLVMGIALARVKSEKIYLKLNFKSMYAYIMSLCKEEGIERSKVYRRLCLGEIYLKYRNELETIGFSDRDSLTKLHYLERALVTGEKKETFENLKNMSHRDFMEYAGSAKQEKTGDTELSEIRGNTVYLDGKKAIIINKNLDDWETDFILKAAQVIYRAKKRRGVIVAVHLRNSKEADLFAIEAERIRAEIQGGGAL